MERFFLPGTRAQDERPDTKLPISKETLEMAAYLHSYHRNEGCAPELDPFLGNKNICDIFLKYRFEEHSASHAGSCLKKDVNVGFYLHSCHVLIHTNIHEDKVTASITALCNIVLTETSTLYIHLWLYSEDQWDFNL